MNINFNFKNFDPSPHLKEYAQKRFGKIEKFVSGLTDPELAVHLSVEKFRQMAEVIFSADDIHVSAYQESEDMYASIDKVLDKLSAQLAKIRDKQKSRRRRRQQVQMDVISFAEATSDPKILESDKYEPKPMSVEEAAEQIQARDLEFLVFQNSQTDSINVIYKRKSGDFGVIIPES